MAIRQIRRLRSAIWRARRTVPSVSASLRLAASSFLIVSRADMMLDGLTIGFIATGGASGVFMERISIILSYCSQGLRLFAAACFFVQYRLPAYRKPEAVSV